jgi:dienelactone hydrolase
MVAGSSPRLFFVGSTGAEVDRIRYGDGFSVRLEGLPAGSEATLQSRMWGYEGSATFTVPADGRIDTAADAPVSGTYEGVAPEGILWSMAPVDPTRDTDLDVHFEAIAPGVTLEATLERAWLDERLLTVPVDDGGIVGQLLKPRESDGPLPGVLVLGGSGGGIEGASFWSAYLADHGYAALALAYFGASGLPAELERIPLEYVLGALEALRARDDVDGARIAVAGVSRGAELALMVGARDPDVSAVIAHLPSGIRWGSVPARDTAAWTLGGEPLPYVRGSGSGAASERLPDGGRGFRFSPVFDAALDDASVEELSAATIEVERIEGPILMFGGGDDGIWPSCRLAERVWDRLASTGHGARYADEYRCFEEAGHFAPQPGWPTTDSYAGQIAGTTVIFGGTPAANARAQRASYDAIVSFLATHLGDGGA